MPSKSDINPSTGKAYAVNPSTGVWDDNYFATQVEPKFKGSSSSVSGGGGIDPNATIEAAIKRMQEANAPAVSSLQASIPETQQKYEQTRTQLEAKSGSLEQRYTNLLDSIKSQHTQSANKQTTITANELGKRGIVGSSTLADQEIQNAVEPVNQYYTGLTKETGLAREDALTGIRDQVANLTTAETGDIRAIQNAIAQLQSGAATSGINLGQNLYSTQVDAAFKNQALQDQQKQQEIENAMKKIALDLQTKETNYNINKPYSTANEGMDITALMSLIDGLMGGDTTEAKPKTNTTPKSFKEISTSNTRFIG